MQTTIDVAPEPGLGRTNLKSIGCMLFKLGPWIGFLICLTILALGRLPGEAYALDQGEAPPVPNLTLTITDDPDPVKIGNTLAYTITVTNDGTAKANNVVITSELDPNVDFGAASSGGTFDPGTRLVSWNVDMMNPGDIVTVAVTVTVTKIPDDKILIANTAKVYSDEGATDCDAVTTTVIAPKLEIHKSDDPDPVALNDMLTYTIVISNAGYAEATGVVITDTLDPNVSFKSASHGGMHDGSATNGVVTWTVASLAPWEIITRTLVVTVVNLPASDELWNTACVTSSEASNDCDDEHTQLMRPVLEVLKLDDPDPVRPGQMLTYTIVVSNVGFANATDVVITDRLDPSVSFKSASHGGMHDGSATNGVVTWMVASLAPGEVITRVVTVQVVEDATCGSEFPNMAEAHSIEDAWAETTIMTAISGGRITVNACGDLNADGICGPDLLDPLPSGIQAHLVDGGGMTTTEAVPAIFDVGPGTYTASLSFTGESQGLYPTLPSKSVTISQCEDRQVDLPVIDPVHPKEVAVYPGVNKVYVAFQGEQIGDNNWPYPFVAVIDSETDQVIKTIPGNEALSPGIGKRPWSVVANDDYVYVGSFDDRWVSVIDPESDTVVQNIGVGGMVPPDFRPAASSRNPNDPHKVHFADYGGGGVLIIEGTTAFKYTNISDLQVFSPFEVTVLDKASLGRNVVTMRDAVNTDFELRAFDTGDDTFSQHDLPVVGSPHAIGLWQNHPSGQPHLYVTYADDPQPGPDLQGFKNPNKLLIYRYDPDTDDLTLVEDNKSFFEYAEAGLIYNPAMDQMLGAYAGFPFWDDSPFFPDWKLCMDDSDSVRGGTYTIDSNNVVADGPLPNRVVGNPPLTPAEPLRWKNSFGLAHNPNNDKVYVTDRCWNDWTGHGGISKVAHGAVLVIAEGLTDTSAERVDTPVQPPTAEDTTFATSAEFNVADVNRDGRVDMVDLALIASHYGSHDPVADINGDGLVDVVDMSIAAANYGQ